MGKKFLVSVADVHIYSLDDVLIAVGKTLVDSSIEMKLSNSDIRGGRSNALQSIFWHSADLNLMVSETQFNLDFLAATVGKSIVTGENVYQEETITLTTNGGGTVTGTPIVINGTSLYGWVSQNDGSTDRVTFSGSTFPTSNGASGDVVCVRYYAVNSAARSLTIDASVLPSIVRVEMETLLISSEESTSRIGVVQIIVPNATLNGSFSLAMKSDSVSTTPLALRALASQDLTTSACSSVPVLAKIIEILDNINWYDSVIGLSIAGGDFSLATTLGTKQLVVYALPQTGAPFIPPTADLTFSSSTANATVSASGLVTGVTTGTPLIKATITNKSAIDANVVCTVPAP